MSSGSSMAAFGSWSTRWSSHMLERWCAHRHQPITTHWPRHPTLTADILVPVGLQEAGGPFKGVVMTGGSLGGTVHASGLHLADAACHTRSVANGARDGECLLAAARVSCVVWFQTVTLSRCTV